MTESSSLFVRIQAPFIKPGIFGTSDSSTISGTMSSVESGMMVSAVTSGFGELLSPVLIFELSPSQPAKAPLVARIPQIMNSRNLDMVYRSEEHTSELQSRPHLVCRLLLEKKKPHPPPP